MSETDGLLEEEKVKQAVITLSKYIEIRQSNKLISDEERLDLQFVFKKIPHNKGKHYKIPLPHPFITDTSDVCLFVKDLNRARKADYELTKEYFKEMLSQKGVVGISAIIPYRQLKQEYKPFEARRNLVNMFTLFLADERIIRFLPRTLGKEFFLKKKLPVQVNLRAVNLSNEITQALKKTYLRVSATGPCSMVQVGLTSQPVDNLASNIISVTRFLATNLEGGWMNIRSIGIKSPDSTLIPLYISEGSSNVAKLPKKQRYTKEEPEAEELSTLENGSVKVYPDGIVKVIIKKPKTGPLKKKIRKSN